MGGEIDFGHIVLKKAWDNSRAFFRSRLHAALTGVASLLIGVGSQWWLSGPPTTVQAVVGAVACTLGTAIVLFGVNFLWHLAVAPNEVVFDEIRPLLQNTIIFGVTQPPNFSIWKCRKHYTANEFAALLVNVDPSSNGATVDFRSMLPLVLEALRSGEIKYVDSNGQPASGQRPGFLPDTGVTIAKADAIAWADEHGFTERIASLR